MDSDAALYYGKKKKGNTLMTGDLRPLSTLNLLLPFILVALGWLISLLSFALEVVKNRRTSDRNGNLNKDVIIL